METFDAPALPTSAARDGNRAPTRPRRWNCSTAVSPTSSPEPSPTASGRRRAENRVLRSTAPIGWPWDVARLRARKRSPWHSSETSRLRNSRWPCSTSMGSSMFPESCPHARPTRTRREFIRDGFCGFGGLALASLLHEEQARAGIADPLAPKPPHHPARARSVIFLFMAGGPSHLETSRPQAAPESAPWANPPEGVRRRQVPVRLQEREVARHAADVP